MKSHEERPWGLTEFARKSQMRLDVGGGPMSASVRVFCVPVNVYPCVCGANLCGLLLLLPEEMVSGCACAE